MTKKIEDALAKLDVANDNHWTNEGAPRLETLRILASDGTISREDVNKVANDFTRESAKAAIAKAAEVVAVDAEGKPSGVVAAGVPVLTDKANDAEGNPALVIAAVTDSAAQLVTATAAAGLPPPTEADNEVAARNAQEAEAVRLSNEPQSELESVQRYLDGLLQDKHDIDQQIDAVQRRRDLLLAQTEASGQTEAEKSQVAIQSYLNAQRKQLEERAAIINSNPALKSTSKSPLDQSLAGRSRSVQTKR